MSGVAAGKLRHRVRIERQTTTLDSFGQQSTGWTLVATVWAAVEPLSAREMIAASQVQSSVTARITIRYMAGLLASDRIVFRGKTYNIAGVLPDAESGLEHITLPVSEGTNAG